MHTKPQKRPMKIVAHDIGERTKTQIFQANHEGQIWFHPDSERKARKVQTPYNVEPRDFMMKLRVALRDENQWHGKPDFRCYSVCGPMAQGDQCLRLVNRGVLESFTVDGNLAMNDGMAGLIGSYVAGVARGHTGATRMFVLGTGLGTADRHYVISDRFKEVLAFGDPEAHFTIAGFDGKCNCGLVGCAEAAVKEAALGDLIEAQGVTRDMLLMPGKPKSNIGRDLEYRLNRTTENPEMCAKLDLALSLWHDRLALIVANVLGGTTLGGDDLREPALIIFGGGLGRFVKPDAIYDRVLALSGGYPQNGTNFKIAVETDLGNKANCVGVAAATLAKFLGMSIDEIQFLAEPPAKKRKH